MAFSKLDLTDRVAVVIGATSGIGRALAVGWPKPWLTWHPAVAEPNWWEKWPMKLSREDERPFG